jgi:hypothetical protein
MKLSVSDLTTDRKWRSVLGLNKKRFEKLLELFEKAYKDYHKKSMAERLADNPQGNSSIRSYEDLLFFTLFSMKSGLTYDVLGVVTGMNGSNAKRNQTGGLAVLNHCLEREGYLPKRGFETVAEFQEYFKNEASLILDGAEQPIQRPSEEEAQKDCYSGKKKTYR